ncbi:MAG TPA: histidine kinase dimerization/phosphoacceptor domain-containing protein [Lysobacter sp.]
MADRARFSTKHPPLLRGAGLLAWAAVGGWLLTTAPDETERGPVVAWIVFQLVFGAAYLIASSVLPRLNSIGLNHACSLVLVLCSVGVSYYSETGLGGILLMVTAGVLPWLMPAPSAVLWLLFAGIAMTCAHLSPPIEMPLQLAIMQLLIHAGFSAFVLAGSLLAKRQTLEREAHERLGTELRAMQLLLAESIASNERTRISRDVHDLLGHRLTALIIHLDVASRQAHGTAKSHLEQSHAIARLLLADVREVVSTLRDHETA